MFGEHAAFIIPSYVISFVAITVTTIVIWRLGKLRKAEIKKLETESADENDNG